jgi:hypothetical protein
VSVNLGVNLSELPPRLREIAIKTAYSTLQAKNSGINWTPLDGPQRAAYLSLADELFYGGAAGGGKSDLMVGLGTTLHTKSVIFRREYNTLRDIINRSYEIIGDKGKFNSQLKIWRFKGSSKILEFGAVEHENDKTKWMGRPHSFKGFDELPQFTESQFRFIKGWTRTVNPWERTRVVGAGNPPTDAEGEWVIQYWAPWLDSQYDYPAIPGELRWYAVVEGRDVEVENSIPFEFKGETIIPTSRTFIPASLGDNPFLERTGYRQVLQAFPEPLRSKFLYGDFSITLDDDRWQVIPSDWIIQAQNRWTKEVPKKWSALSCVGMDIAQGGSDNTVLTYRHGYYFKEQEIHPGTSVPDAEKNARLLERALIKGGIALLDCDGIGASTYFLARAYQTCAGRVLPFTGSTRVTDITDKSGRIPLYNLRAVAYWKFREALDPANGLDIMLPPDRKLRQELSAARWMLGPSGLKIEPKDHIIDRLVFAKKSKISFNTGMIVENDYDSW